VVALEVDGRRLALWCTASGRPAAVDARCPHQWADLATEGAVEGEELVCGAHGWCFDVAGRGAKRTEAGRLDPKADVAAVPVRRVGAHLVVEVPPPG
jgi:phenylpropionate dioxygenase-like ring-hydroxylating dioxygenase large terminal subunit